MKASAIGMAISVTGCLSDGTDSWESSETLAVQRATQYQSPNCSCCDVYVGYLQDHLEGEVDVTISEDIGSIKRRYNIPRDLQSCHTVMIDGYVVEGHMPVSVIAALLDDEPGIKGIALPEMPAGSPGMGGEKRETWTVYEFQSETEIAVYAEL